MTDNKRIKLSKFQPKRTFGVEMEFTTSLSKNSMSQIINTIEGENAIVSSYQHNNDNNKWFCKPDSSCGNEVASRVLGSSMSIRKCIEDLNLVTDIHGRLLKAGAVVSHDCGGHVHIGILDFSSEQIEKLMAYWVKMEKFIFEMLPRRRATDQYCVKLSDNFTANTAYDSESIKCHFRDRKALNFAHCCADSRHDNNVVEIRCGEGMADPRDLKNWVRFLIQLFNKVKEAPMPQNLNWMTLREGLRFLDLLPEKGATDVLVLSPALSELREWTLTRISCFAHFRNGEEQRARAKRLQQELYPTPYGSDDTVAPEETTV